MQIRDTRLIMHAEMRVTTTDSQLVEPNAKGKYRV